jgi:acetyltransferase-like isoleucine patch superfamily enzyme
MTSFYTKTELDSLGFKSVGDNVQVSRFARFYGIEGITLGNQVRIDDFCILSGEITLGNFIHISAYCALYGSKGIVMDDFSGLSPRTTVFSASDDFSGNFLVGPMVDGHFTNVTGGKVTIGKYVQVGANCVVLPDLILEEGVAVGALSLVNKSLPAWGIYAGVPAQFVKTRSREMCSVAEKFLSHD